jgi:hypothetical protein
LKQVALLVHPLQRPCSSTDSTLTGTGSPVQRSAQVMEAPLQRSLPHVHIPIRDWLTQLAFTFTPQDLVMPLAETIGSLVKVDRQ